MSPSPQPESTALSENVTSGIGSIYAFLLLRLWLALRAIQTGIEKYAGYKTIDSPVQIDGQANSYGLTAESSEKAYSLSNYQGVPEALYGKLATEPLIPGWALGFYDALLGPALIILGLTLLLGFATRLSLFAMGLLYASLTFGLVLIKQDAGVAWLATHIILIALALNWSNHNRLALSNFKPLGFSKNW